MSNVSIRSVPLPLVSRRGMAQDMARRAVLRMLERLAVGTLTLHEGQSKRHFGQVLRGREAIGSESVSATSECSPLHAEVHVHNPELFSQMLTGGSIGAGEAYMRGHWSSPDPMQVMRVFCANMAVLDGMDNQQSFAVKMALRLAHFFKRNTRAGSKDNIAAHYDLGNDFFELFLDPTMMYSSALYAGSDATLHEASLAKLAELCAQLELSQEDHLLEIGTGWGGMAIYAAQHYGCRVTTTTISNEQFEYARNRVREAGLEDRVTVLCEDYRSLTGSYDKLVSVEMIEAVGHQFYAEYFRTCSDLLKANGRMVIQAITMADQRYLQARDSVDFIQKYIFPGGCLPSVEVIAKHLARDTDMQMVHLRDVTQDYAKTLAHWRERFLQQLDNVRAMGFNEEFIRMWDFYLCYCEGGFRERVIGTVQLAFAKPGYRF